MFPQPLTLLLFFTHSVTFDFKSSFVLQGSFLEALCSYFTGALAFCLCAPGDSLPCALPHVMRPISSSAAFCSFCLLWWAHCQAFGDTAALEGALGAGGA